MEAVKSPAPTSAQFAYLAFDVVTTFFVVEVFDIIAW